MQPVQRCVSDAANVTEGTDFGQSRFGHPDLTNFGQSNFGQSIFGHRGSGQSNFGQSIFGQSNFGQSFGIWCVSWWVPEGWVPEGWGPQGWGAQNFALFFPSPATVFILFSLSFGLFRGILVVRDPQMCAFGVLGLSCASPGGPAT